VTTRTVTTPDGRSLALHEGGDPDGLAVFVHHGTPSSGILYEPWVEHAGANGIRLIGFDRAGYGGSTRLRARDISAAAADADAIADALGLERFATWGISGGGPHALACAALCGDRLTAAASLAGVAPWEAEGLDWLALLAGGIDEMKALLDSLLGDADRAVLAGGIAEWMDVVDRNGLRDSADGWVDDDLAFAAPWGFDPAAVSRPVLIVQGGDDRFVPRSHGEWLAAHVPGAEAWIDDADGHLTLLEHRVPEVQEWLLAHS